MTKRTTTAALGAAALVAALALPQPALAADPLVRVVAGGFAGPTHVDVEGSTAHVADAFAGTLSEVDVLTGETEVLASDLDFSPGVGTRRAEVLVTSSVLWGPEARNELLRVAPDGTTTVVADLRAHELAENPDGQPFVDEDAASNPYAVLALPGRTLIADAAANAILSVSPQGAVRTLAVLPVSTDGECADVENNGVPGGGCDAVPTDVALGPDGHLYVTGLGAHVEGRVWRINQGGKVVQTWTGLPPLTGVAVDDRGTVYVSSLEGDDPETEASEPTLFRLSGDGSVAGSDAVPVPTGLDLEGGTLYVPSLRGQLFAVSPAVFDAG